MNTTYKQELARDEARINAEAPLCADATLNAQRAGRFVALANYYASCADFEAAQRQRLGRDPKALITTFCGQIGGPSADDIAVLLDTLFDYLRLRPELEDARAYIEEAAACAKFQAEAEALRNEEHRAEDELAAHAEDLRERRIDDELTSLAAA